VVFLWTDILIWLLLFSTVGLGFVISKSKETRAKWREIFKSKLAIISAIILGFYIFFTLIDSIHFRDNSSSSSFTPLDLAFKHRAYTKERTYSSPFALKEYTKDIHIDKSGRTEQIYRPLKYVKGGNFILNTLKAILIGGLISFFAIFLHMRYFKRDKAIPWLTAYITFATLVTLFSWLYIMSFDYHVLGTDKVGGDVLYQSLKSIRTGVLIGLLTTLIMLPFAILLGVSAGFFGGIVDDVIQYIYTTLNSVPAVLLIASAVLLTDVLMDSNPTWFETVEQRADLRLLFLILILGITSWTSLCRLLRAETLKISQLDFVIASKAFGVGSWTIIKRHIIPNLMHIILISVVLDFSGLVLAEAVLSYVGVGVDPTMYSWGNMINQARLEMAREPMVWWSLFSAFIFMFALVLSANLLSDRVQFVLDPKNRG
jgi:peptide/nickel transport system permease protein